MSEFVTFVMTVVFCLIVGGVVSDHQDDLRVQQQRFTHKGQIYMLVPAKLSPVSLATKDP